MPSEFKRILSFFMKLFLKSSARLFSEFRAIFNDSELFIFGLSLGVAPSPANKPSINSHFKLLGRSNIQLGNLKAVRVLSPIGEPTKIHNLAK